MKPPAFWDRDGVLPTLLSPIARVVEQRTARRVAQPGWQAPVPVICCGNASVGGAGKTTVALAILRRLTGRSVRVHCLSRGYGGRVREATRVRLDAPASQVGDEPLLLAEVAPTWVGPDRAASARAAVAAGAEALVMDDGLQNPGLVSDCGLLVIDGGYGFGNGRVMPAGPLREPPAAAAARCKAAVLIGPDRTGALRALPRSLPVLRAKLVASERLDGLRVFAFAGIARPAKFYRSLEDAGAEIAGLQDFPDHHAFRTAELMRVLSRAAALGAEPITTAKDMVRLPPSVGARVRVLGVRVEWEDAAALDAILPC